MENRFVKLCLFTIILPLYLYRVMIWIVPLIFLVLFETVADVLSKEWSLRNHWWLAVAALTSYVICNSFWLLALKNGSGLARGIIIFAVSSTILTTLIGLWWYQEKLSTVQTLGVFVGLLALVLIFWE